MSGDTILLSVIGLGVGGLLVREVWGFLQWKRSLGRLDRAEWSRMVRALRDK